MDKLQGGGIVRLSRLGIDNDEIHYRQIAHHSADDFLGLLFVIETYRPSIDRQRITFSLDDEVAQLVEGTAGQRLLRFPLDDALSEIKVLMKCLGHVPRLPSMKANN